MNKKILVSAFAVAVICGLALALAPPLFAVPFATPKELDLNVSGTNDCLRFLNSTVSVCYVPIVTGANEDWRLTINATKMPGGANGWTDVYVYNGYWNKGTDYKCQSKDLYPLLEDIESTDAQIRGDAPFTATYGGSTPQSLTVFFIFPPGGPAMFHVALKQQ